MNTMGTGINANTNGQKGTEKDKPLHKNAMKGSQIKMSQNKGNKANKGKLDTPKYIHIRQKKEGKKIKLA